MGGIIKKWKQSCDEKGDETFHKYRIGGGLIQTKIVLRKEKCIEYLSPIHKGFIRKRHANKTLLKTKPLSCCGLKKYGEFPVVRQNYFQKVISEAILYLNQISSVTASAISFLVNGNPLILFSPLASTRNWSRMIFTSWPLLSSGIKTLSNPFKRSPRFFGKGRI